MTLDILKSLAQEGSLTTARLDAIIRKHSKREGDGRRKYAKKHVLAYYLDVRENKPELYASWHVPEELHEAFLRTMQMKPRRTASGVATITVITKPWHCSSSCHYCPSDIRMPKSYLHDEPACQRAERNFFDPYLQVASRLSALQNMGHDTDKIELIVLGGSWTDYPHGYRYWYASELFRALNDSADQRETTCQDRRELYRSLGIESDAAELERSCRGLQNEINSLEITYNEAVDRLYLKNGPWNAVSELQHADVCEVKRQHIVNEAAKHRVVGLVVETRPETLSARTLVDLREIGCTKVQIGVQSLDDDLLKANGRTSRRAHVARAFGLCRLFGFKIHAHLMLNLVGATPQADKADFEHLVKSKQFAPDEVKLYPCALVAGTRLARLHEEGAWSPYSEEELVDVLCADMQACPPFVRVSRMIRDISAKDILVGNKKTNLRQIVENELQARNASVNEIRFREIATNSVDLASLALDEYRYETEVATELFLQWVTPDGRICGFLRLSLPKPEAVDELGAEAPIKRGEAMIREVHVYGFAAKIASEGSSAQHHGLGKALIGRACGIAQEHGYRYMNVISAVGTREYYRRLGFDDNGLYQRKDLGKR